MSRQLDSLLKGLSMFSEGVSTAMQNKAIGEATKEAEQLAMSTELDAEERVNQLDALASNLRLKLMQSGASASKADTAGASIGLTPYQRAVLENQQMTQVAKSMRGAQSAETKSQASKADFLVNVQKDFDRFPGVSKAREAIDASVTAEDMLTAKNPIGDQAIKTFMARATGEVGNLTEAEREMFAGSKELARRADRIISVWSTGKIPPKDREDLRLLNKIMKQAAQKNLERKAKDYSARRARALEGVGIKQDEVLSMIAPTSQTDSKRARAEALVDQKLQSSDVLDPAKRDLYIEQVLKGMK